MESNNAQVSCWICPFSSITQKGLAIHLQKVHDIKLNKNTSRCNKPRPRKRVTPRRRSMNAVSWTTPFSCSRCSYRSATKEELLEHVQRGFHVRLPGDPTGRTFYEGPPAGLQGRPADPGFRHETFQDASGIIYQTQPYNRNAVYQTNGQEVVYQSRMAVPYVSQESSLQRPIDEAMAEIQFGMGQVDDKNCRQPHDSLPPSWHGRVTLQGGQPMEASYSYAQAKGKRPFWNDRNNDITYWPTQTGTVPIVLKKGVLTHGSQNGEPQNGDGNRLHTLGPAQNVQSHSEESNRKGSTAIPCPECGCHRRGGCAVAETQQSVPNENKIILIDQDNLGEGTGVEEVYHLQGDAGLEMIEAANVTQVVTQGDEIVLDYRTEDGRQFLLRAVRADQMPASSVPVTEDTTTQSLDWDLQTTPEATEGSPSKMDAEGGDKNVESSKPVTVSMPDGDATNDHGQTAAQLNPTSEETTLQPKLPELFPELFDTKSPSASENDANMPWASQDAEQTQSANTSSPSDFDINDEAQGFVKIFKNSDMIAVLSSCRSVTMGSEICS